MYFSLDKKIRGGGYNGSRKYKCKKKGTKTDDECN